MDMKGGGLGDGSGYVTATCKTDGQREPAKSTGSSARGSVVTRRVGRETQEKGVVSIHIANSLCCTLL